MTIAELHFHFLNSAGICTDTRKLTKGQIYLALKGDNFNGNKFAQQAIINGAALAIVDEDKFHSGEKTVLVENGLTTLQQLATYHRNYLNLPIISLTGSNGKTTTKELINAVLLKKFRTVATQGNLNNHIGVPLTLLSMDEDTELGIVEMGANHQGEIHLLSTIAQPNYGYITNFGKAHLEGFGGIEGVIKGKSELYTYLKKQKGIAFVNDRDPLQVKRTKGLETSTFGSIQSAAPISFVNANPSVTIKIQDHTIETQLIGRYNFSNIAAAVAIGTYFDVSTLQIKEAIEAYIPENNRSQIIKKQSYQIILDAYNANPTSMAAALENLSIQDQGSRVAFIGDMFEVGDTTKEEHQNILKLASDLKIEKVIAIGPTFGISKPLKHQEVYKDYHAFAKAYSYPIPKNATVLIKGSRGMKMERILNLLEV